MPTRPCVVSRGKGLAISLHGRVTIKIPQRSKGIRQFGGQGSVGAGYQTTSTGQSRQPSFVSAGAEQRLRQRAQFTGPRFVRVPSGRQFPSGQGQLGQFVGTGQSFPRRGRGRLRPQSEIGGQNIDALDEQLGEAVFPAVVQQRRAAAHAFQTAIIDFARGGLVKHMRAR